MPNERPLAILADLWRETELYDAALDAEPRPQVPTGDDYNAIVGFVRAAALRAHLDQPGKLGAIAAEGKPDPTSAIGAGVPRRRTGSRTRLLTIPALVRASNNILTRLERIEVKLWPEERKRNFTGTDGTIGIRSPLNGGFDVA